MGLILFISLGLGVGLIARAVMPGAERLGTVMTIALGVTGSFVGGFFASLLSGQRFGDLHVAGIIGSVCGALALLFLIDGIPRGRASSR